MPVMLRANDATETCITKGQEGAVVGWDESVGPLGQKVLDTLFVKLINPPKNIQVDGLPPNVVPLLEQIVALVNFGMTDYTSQGKSRVINVVELGHCKNHMSYYVALSRGTSAKGTVIVQNLSTDKITGGMSGYLRQELRELEILDEITRLRCAGLLPPSVTGLYRRRLIRSFYAWKSTHNDPVHFHPSMRWNVSMGPRVPETVTYSEWRPSVKINNKRKKAEASGEASAVPEPPAKRAKVDSQVRDKQRPYGANSSQNTQRWHDLCAYDATFTTLANIWAENPELWRARFSAMSDLMSRFSSNLTSVQNNLSSLEQARDGIRRRMHGQNASYFPYGPNQTSIDRLASALFPDKTYALGKQSCPRCGFTDPVEYNVFEAWMTASLNDETTGNDRVPLRTWMHKYMTRGRNRCPACRARHIRCKMVMLTRMTNVPGILLIDVNDARFTFDEELAFDCDNQLVRVKLRGIIYGGGGHFTSRFIDAAGNVWFHDGIATGRRCVPDIQLRELNAGGSLQRLSTIFLDILEGFLTIPRHPLERPTEVQTDTIESECHLARLEATINRSSRNSGGTARAIPRCNLCTRVAMLRYPPLRLWGDLITLRLGHALIVSLPVSHRCLRSSTRAAVRLFNASSSETPTSSPSPPLPPPSLPFSNGGPSVMAPPSNVLIVITLLSFYCGAGFADFVPPTATVTGSFSIVYPTNNESASPSQNSMYPTSTTFPPSSITPTISIPPPPQPDLSQPSEFVRVVDNPTILASLIVSIIAVTILCGVIYQVYQTRKRLRDFPPLPVAYMISPRDSRSLSLKNVVVSPRRTPPPIWIPPPPVTVPPAPRPPSPARTFASRSSAAASDLPSSDIHHIQRALRGISVVGSIPLYRADLAASRSSLGTTTTKTRPSSAANVPNADWVRRHDGRRYGVQWDVEAGR
ncbi:hypothetical protein FB451DRAFT_1368625 [Mycena latifolia]|nr:hypothetical protein FB451DRAFT_1368625 [Mycena latifolia]